MFCFAQREAFQSTPVDGTQILQSAENFYNVNLRDHISVLTHCDLCGGSTEQAYIAARGCQRLLNESTTLSTVLCPQCRFVFQRDRFSDELLGALYASDTSFEFDPSPALRAVVEANLVERRRVISDAMAQHGFDKHATVLDIGGGIGECCTQLVDEHNVLLVDASDREPVDPRIRKIPGLFAEQLAEGSCDVVVLNHVLEHVFSPSRMLNSVHRVTRPNGIVVVEVPFELYTPLVARHLGDWRHVVYFSRATLAKFLAKAGFSVQRMALEEGCYGPRRLPVIRAVAKKSLAAVSTTYRNSIFSLVRDMLAPAPVHGLLQRVLGRS